MIQSIPAFQISSTWQMGLAVLTVLHTHSWGHQHTMGMGVVLVVYLCQRTMLLTNWLTSDLTRDLLPHQSAQRTTTDQIQRGLRHSQHFLTHWGVILTKVKDTQEECGRISLLQVSRATFSLYIGPWTRLINYSKSVKVISWSPVSRVDKSWEPT